MNEIPSFKLNRLCRSEAYWKSAYICFIATFFLPVGAGAIKSVLYLAIIIPALLLTNRAILNGLSRSPVFILLTLLALSPVLATHDHYIIADSAKFILSSAGIIIGATHLHQTNTNTIRCYCLIALACLIAYVLTNATVHFFRGSWVFGGRIPMLYGQAKSVIFTSNLVVSVLILYSWASLKQERKIEVAIVNFAVLLLILFFLQSRSAFVVWLIAMGALVFSLDIRRFKQTGLVLLLSISLVSFVLATSGIGSQLLARADSYRIEIWQGYANATLHCGLLFGCGWGSELGFITQNGNAIAHPHSMYLQTFYWGGISGLILLLACLGAALYEGWKKSSYLFWLLLPGSIALAMDGKSLISAPNERWLLVLLPLLFSAAEQVKLRLLTGQK